MNPPETDALTPGGRPGHYYSYGIPYLSIDTYPGKLIAIEGTDATFEDHMAPRPIKLALAPLNLHLKSVSSDLAKPIAVDIDGTLNRKGAFKVTGSAAPIPLKAELSARSRI